MEATATAGRIPYQLKFALQQVMQARVAAEGCTLTATQFQLFFGLEAANLMRFLDSGDTSLANTPFPCTGGKFGFNWKDIKAGFPGIVLPSSCKSATFATTGCNVKLNLLPNLNIELSLKDTCKDETQYGYGLPQISASCSGTLCSVFGRPCTQDADCSGLATCDGIPDSNITNWLDPLESLGLYHAINDDATCNTGGQNAQQKFWSMFINTAANMVGLTSAVSPTVYSTVKMCGISSFISKVNPSQAPTPSESFQCPGGGTLPPSQVCDGIVQCPSNNADEAMCRCGNNTVPQRIDDGQQFNWNCCPICPDPNAQYTNQYGQPYYCTYSYCGYVVPAKVSPTFCDPPPANGQPIDCPSFIQASTGPAAFPARQSLSFASTTVRDENVLAWSDCNGNVQALNAGAIGVANLRLPFQNIAAALENVISTVLSCRNTAVGGPTTIDWARFFYVWSVNHWGGLFFSTQSSGGPFADWNPGAKVDDEVRYYKSSQTQNCSNCYGAPCCNCRCDYVQPPPFANVANAPASCNLASATAAGGGSCELQLDVSSWFAGSAFPAGWGSGQTILRLKAASTCANSKLGQFYFTCEGPCNTTHKSGCCMLSSLMVPQSAGQCPQGYYLATLDSGMTDFLFNHTNPTAPKSVDTTLINFLSLVQSRNYKFGNGFAQFVMPSTDPISRSTCVVNMSAIGANQDSWATAAVTENCPVPPQNPPTGQGCPQFLSGGPIQGCGANCLQPAVATTCGANCPLAPTPATPVTVPGAAASVTVGFLGLVVGLLVV
jgi:hypothetical protein